MLLRIFKGISPRVISVSIITLAAIWLSAFLNPQLPGSFLYESSPMPFYGLIKSVIGNSAIAGVIFSLIVLSLLTTFMAVFNTKVFFISERTLLPAAIYILITGIFPQQQILNPVLPAAVFLMLAIMRIMEAYRKPGTAFNFFDAGLLISIGSLFYCNLIWFSLIVFIGIALLRPVNIIEIAVSFLGIITPYLLLTGIFYVAGKDIGALFTDMRINLFGQIQDYHFGWLTIAILIFTGGLVLVSLTYLISRINAQKIKSRKTFNLLLWTFFISIGMYICLPSVSTEIAWITGIPASYILAYYFIFSGKKLINGILFTLFYLLILIIQAVYIL